MARVVETAVIGFEDVVRVEKVVTRTPGGARRFQEIIRTLGRPVAVPAILINGAPVFEMTPGVDELQRILHEMKEQPGSPGRHD